MSTTSGHCGLCNVQSLYLVASQWGQVCRPCWRAKHRRAGAQERAAQQAREAELREEDRQQGYDAALVDVAEWLRARSEDTRRKLEGIGESNALPLWFHGESRVAAALEEAASRLKQGEPLRESLREEGRQMGLQHERAAVLRWLGDVVDGRASLPLRPGLTGAVGALQAVLEALEAGEHLKEGG